MSKQQPPQERTINLELREQEAEGVYANLAVITHSSSEFILDFARIMPGVNKARIQARIVMTPQNFKNLQRAIADNIAKFETQNGQIPGGDQLPARVSVDGPLKKDDDKKMH
ncbi:MAG: DUF3467 domain-containing protein [Candidatus Glassbacteria bacterium]|nr:DUF3467 domain-containing protein [Candidatus Glassbacteria bacterium]